ncbi:MAG TPA: cob(I)yrinic acid a,c-diamide adenosyltransferase [Gemmatimonadales bacterium]|nr:cob(I)yrinic acid a,c-diamide adenosyltransferase [Gemmatimonadales bacterium]
MSKIYTRTGDTGQTALFGGGRVSKDHPRVVAYGDVDELNAALGAVLACEPVEFERQLLEAVQRDLFAIGGQLAAPQPDKVAKALAKTDLPASRVAELEAAIDRATAELPALTAFVLPGGTMKGALLHVSRTVCRRAERSVVALGRLEHVPPSVITYLNRLSDLLFTLARLTNHRSGSPEARW